MKLVSLLSLLILIGCSETEQIPQKSRYSHTARVTDMNGRSIQYRKKPKRIICSGAGALRLVTYLNAVDRVIGVENIEKRMQQFESRPYRLANPQLQTLPLTGEYRGNDNPELIAMLEPQPQLIIKTYNGSGTNPDELTRKTGIPVLTLNYGNLTSMRPQFYESLKLLGQVLGLESRADSVIAYFNSNIKELNRRTEKHENEDREHPYIGGIAYSGIRGIRSTEFYYPPFAFTNTPHIAEKFNDSPPVDSVKKVKHIDISSEQLIKWNPEMIFLDLSTTRAIAGDNGLNELEKKLIYSELPAVTGNEIYGVLPYNFYTTNYGSVLANCWYVGKTLYPDQFSDIESAKKADEIFTFLVGKPIFDTLNATLNNRAFTKIELERTSGKE